MLQPHHTATGLDALTGSQAQGCGYGVHWMS